MNYTVEVICMDFNINKRIVKKELKNEKIIYVKPIINIQSVHISFIYIFILFYKYLISKKNTLFLIHYPSPLDSFIISILYFLKKRKFITVFHANIINKNYMLMKITEFWSKKCFKFSDKIIFTSKRLLDNNANKLNITHKSLYLPIEFSSKDNNIPKINDELNFKLLFIGRLVSYKGVEYLINALEGVQNIQLDIFGDGILKENLIQLTKNKGLNDRIKFHTDLSEKKKHELLSSSNCLVLPSINEAEAFGVVQLEALNYGLPVINTDLPTGVPDVSIHMKSGLTVPPKNSHLLKEAILLLKNNSKLYNNLSRGALEQSKNFEHEKLFSMFKEKLFENEK